MKNWREKYPAEYSFFDWVRLFHLTFLKGPIKYYGKLPLFLKYLVETIKGKGGKDHENKMPPM